MNRLASAIVVLASTATAAADALDSGYGWEGGIAYHVGTFDAGPAHDLALGTRLEGGAHAGHLSLLGEYTFFSLDPIRAPASPPGLVTSWSGRAHRVGGTLRYRIGGMLGTPLPPDPRLANNRVYSYLWLEAGLGEQLGDALGAQRSRGDYAAGAGWQMSFRPFPRGGRQVGYYVALRMTAARAPEDASAAMPIASDAMSACRGTTCPSRAADPRTDRSYLVTLGVVFGD